MRASDTAQDLGAGIAQARAYVVRQESTAHKVTSEHDDIRVQRIDSPHHLTDEVRLAVLVVVNITHLRNAKAMECLGQARQPDSPLDYLKIMAVPESGVCKQTTTGSERGQAEELSPRHGPPQG